jgi:SAM-dependent methyltransferase
MKQNQMKGSPDLGNGTETRVRRFKKEDNSWAKILTTIPKRRLQNDCVQPGRLLEDAIRQAIRALQLEQGSVGLDAGCGIGTHTIQLGEAVGPGGKVTGLDISPGFLDFARKTAQQSGMLGKLDFQQGDMLDLPFEDNTFDFVWGKDSLWPGLGKDPVVALKEFARVVRPGGIIAVLYCCPDAAARLPGTGGATDGGLYRNNAILEGRATGSPFFACAWLDAIGRLAGH